MQRSKTPEYRPSRGCTPLEREISIEESLDRYVGCCLPHNFLFSYHNVDLQDGVRHKSLVSIPSTHFWRFPTTSLCALVAAKLTVNLRQAYQNPTLKMRTKCFNYAGSFPYSEVLKLSDEEWRTELFAEVGKDAYDDHKCAVAAMSLQWKVRILEVTFSIITTN